MQKKYLILLFFYLSLFIPIILSTGLLNDQDSLFTANTLYLELDKEIPEMVGKEFSIKFTAVSKEDYITVKIYFDNIISQPVFIETRDFFINYEVTINTVEAELLTGISHKLTIEASDTLDTESIDRTMTIDIINPIFSFLSLQHLNNQGEKTTIETNAEMHQNERLHLNWTVYDLNFKSVRLYIDNIWDGIDYPIEASKIFTEAHFPIAIPNVESQTFELKIIALDNAENTDTKIFQVKMYKPDINYIPEEEIEIIREQLIKERKEAVRGSLLGTLGFAVMLGIILGTLLGAFSRDKIKGYKFKASSFLKSDQEKIPEELTTWKTIRKYFLSKFGLFTIISTLILIIYIFISWLAIKYLIINLESIFFQEALSKFLIAFPFVFIFAHITSFLTIQPKFTDIKIQRPPSKETNNKVQDRIISTFDNNGNECIATNSFIDAFNGKYLQIIYEDSERLRFETFIENDIYSGIYIPVEKISITDGTIKIDPFRIKGAYCIQEIIDSKNKASQESKFLILTEMQKVDQENGRLQNTINQLILNEQGNKYKGLGEAIKEIDDLDKTGKTVIEKAKETLQEKVDDKAKENKKVDGDKSVRS